MKQNTSIEKIKSIARRIRKNIPIEIKLCEAHTSMAVALGFRDWHELTARLKEGVDGETKQRFKNLDICSGNDGLNRAAIRFSETSGYMDIANTMALFEEYLVPAMDRWALATEELPEPLEEVCTQPPSCMDELDTQPFPEPIDSPPRAVSVDSYGQVVVHKQKTIASVARKRRRYTIAGSVEDPCTDKT